MRISDWSSDVCSSDLGRLSHLGDPLRAPKSDRPLRGHVLSALHDFVQEPFVRKNVKYQPIILGFPGGYGASGAQHLDRAGITYDHQQPERRTAAGETAHIHPVLLEAGGSGRIYALAGTRGFNARTTTRPNVSQHSDLRK